MNREYYAIVDSISFVTINGVNLQKWELTKHCVTLPGITPFDSSSHGKLIIVENIGPVTDYLLYNRDGCGAVGWDVDYCDLTCYKSDSIDYGQTPCNPLILGLKNIDNLNHLIQVNPNPVIDEISIELIYYNKEEELKIYSIMGELIEEHKISKPKQIINLNHLSPGVYLLKVSIDEQAAYKKIIKQ